MVHQGWIPPSIKTLLLPSIILLGHLLLCVQYTASLHSHMYFHNSPSLQTFLLSFIIFTHNFDSQLLYIPVYIKSVYYQFGGVLPQTWLHSTCHVMRSHTLSATTYYVGLDLYGLCGHRLHAYIHVIYMYSWHTARTQWRVGGEVYADCITSQPGKTS